MPRRRPVRDAATEVEQCAIELREFLALLSSDGVEVHVDFVGIHNALVFRVKLPSLTETANHKKGE